MDELPSFMDRRVVNRLSPSLLTLLASFACACLVPNPAFDPAAGSGTGGGSSATSEADSGTSTTTTSSGTDAPTTAGSSTGAPITSEPTTGVADTSSGSSGTSTSGTTSSGSSGMGMPKVSLVMATIGTCVFPAVRAHPFHGGPGECSGDADLINNTGLTGLMMVDVQVNDMAGKTRPAVPVLRFDLPAEGLEGLTLVTATLHVQVSDGVMFLPQSGEVWRASPFTVDSLNVEAPTLVEFLAADKGEVQPDEVLTWDLDPASIVPGQPLFVALKPTHDKGVVLRGATTPGAPYLTLVFE